MYDAFIFFFFKILMSLQEIEAAVYEVLHLPTLHTPLSQNMTRGPWSSDVTGGVQGLVTFGDKGGSKMAPKLVTCDKWMIKLQWCFIKTN